MILKPKQYKARRSTDLHSNTLRYFLDKFDAEFQQEERRRRAKLRTEQGDNNDN